MELEDDSEDGEEEEDLFGSNIEVALDDNEMIHLPDEWVCDLQKNATEYHSSGLIGRSLELVSSQNNVAAKGGPGLANTSYELVLPQNSGVASSEEQTSVILQSSSKGDENGIGCMDVDLACQEIKKPGWKKGSKKQQQWESIIPLRRSSRNLDNDKTTLEKAQDIKRKWFLEEDPGIKKNKPFHICKDNLNSVAKNIGVVIVDDNQVVLDSMVALHKDRVANSKKGCKHKDCNCSVGLELDPSSSKVAIPIKDNPGDDKIPEDTKELVHPERDDGNSNETGLERDWSKVENRKKKVYKKK